MEAKKRKNDSKPRKVKTFEKRIKEPPQRREGFRTKGAS